jgi:hypothetical protein
VPHRGEWLPFWLFKPINHHAQSTNFEIESSQSDCTKFSTSVIECLLASQDRRGWQVVPSLFPISQSQTRDFSASRL